MANFFKPEKSKTDRYFDLEITDLDGRCCGVGHVGDRTWFVPGTVPGDRVRVERKELSKGVGTATVQKMLSPSKRRVAKGLCPYVGVCGGCSCQTVTPEMQIEAKCRGLQQVFRKNVGVELPTPDRIVTGNAWNYRRVCRLSTYFNRKTGKLEVGFKQASSNKIAQIESCMVLETEISALLPAVREVLNHLEARSFIGHIELLKADNGLFMLLRHNRELGSADAKILEVWARANNVSVFLQSNGAENACPLVADSLVPCFSVFGVRYEFTPDAFIQINGAVNEEMIRTAVEYAAPDGSASVLDLFSGIGNFTLQLALKAGSVTGVEVVDSMVKRASDNAKLNGISNADFVRCDLSGDFSREEFARARFDTVLLDPGRDGAAEASAFLGRKRPARIVYVSCNPITATRDFKILHDAGYSISRWSCFDAFCHTSHVETVVLMSRDKA